MKAVRIAAPLEIGVAEIERPALGAGVTDSTFVMVIGCGMVGLGAVVRASLRGATVIAADIDDEKLELARQAGATYTVNTMTEDVHARIQEITDGLGADVVLEAVGSPATYVMAVNEVGFTGCVTCIGSPRARCRSRQSCSYRKSST